MFTDHAVTVANAGFEQGIAKRVFVHVRHTAPAPGHSPSVTAPAREARTANPRTPARHIPHASLEHVVEFDVQGLRDRINHRCGMPHV